MNNRQLKFRAWDTVTKQMIFTGFHLFGEVTCFDLVNQWVCEHPNPYNENQSSLERMNDVEIMQFTGLQDSEGVDIYEGDIVHWKDGSGFDEPYPCEGLYEVKWNENALRLDFYDPYDNVWWPLSDTGFDKIIGNVCENPLEIPKDEEYEPY